MRVTSILLNMTLDLVRAIPDTLNVVVDPMRVTPCRHTECAILDPVSMNEGEWHTEHDPGSSGGDPRHSAYYPESTK